MQQAERREGGRTHLVHVEDDDRLRVLRLDVLARAALAVAACSDFEVAAFRGRKEQVSGQRSVQQRSRDLQATVDLVLLRTVCSGERERDMVSKRCGRSWTECVAQHVCDWRA